MIKRFLITAVLLAPALAPADDFSKAEKTFEARCASCHSLSRTMKMLSDINPQERPPYLKKFLRSHPNKLKDADEDLVIKLLSQPGK